MFVLKKYLQSQRGNALAEAALLLPVFLLLVLGVADIGKGFTTFTALANASREGARWMTVNPGDQAGARQRVAVEAARAGLAAGDIGVTFLQQADGAGILHTVTVTHDYGLLYGAMPMGSIPFSSQSTFREMQGATN